MLTGRRKQALVFTPEEEAKLKMLAGRPKTDQRTAMRAHIILDCASGMSHTEVAAKRAVTMSTVGKWRGRFAALRLDGGADASRSGQPRRITGAQVEEVVTKTLESRPEHATHWSTRSMPGRWGSTRTRLCGSGAPSG